MSEFQELKDIQFHTEKIATSEIHSFFTQAIQSNNRGLFLAGSLCYVAGIEASLRGAMARINGLTFYDDYGALLSNRLLRDAYGHGLPVDALSMEPDINFKEAIKQNKPNVSIVGIRHALAHGNLTEYVNREYSYFTVELLEELSYSLEIVSKNWISELSESTSNPY